jgi:hypothetical protein
MSELGNGKMSKPKGLYTGDRLQLVKREQIVSSLSRGESICSIARTLRVARETVRLVREQEYAEISRRKMLIRDSAARLAVDGFDRLNEEMQAGKIKGSLLMTVTGMATDKVVALSNDALQINITQPIEPGKRLWERLNELAAAIERKALSNDNAVLDSRAETGLTAQEETAQKGEVVVPRLTNS